ncbi:hypothetical protein, partial [Pseudomonas syringae group genomosp. 3]|uniref:hypothetical protein n=1 Tax=Pseudomonas syringae group genomosp. 3 TaxID=251701 RepID=UPI0016512DC3
AFFKVGVPRPAENDGVSGVPLSQRYPAAVQNHFTFDVCTDVDALSLDYSETFFIQENDDTFNCS